MPLRHKKRKAGFTLIELLVVIAIIALLASVVMVSLASARAKGKEAAAQSQLVQIKKAFTAYFAEHGTYPSGGVSNFCNMCTYWGPSNPHWDNGYNSEPYAIGDWTTLINGLVADGVINASGKNSFIKDPWGHVYLYDDNYDYSCNTWSPICSRGPDGYLETPNCSPPPARGDDVCVFLYPK